MNAEYFAPVKSNLVTAEESFNPSLTFIRMPVNPDLLKERAASTFNSEELTFIWDGNQENTLKRRRIEKLVFSDPDLLGPDNRQVSRDVAYGESIRKHMTMWKRLKQHGITDDFERFCFLRAVFGAEPSGLLMHDVAFFPMLSLQASDEQLNRWLPLIKSFQMIGCYAQTELAHGSFVRGLETTAVYDEKSKEFVLNTPSLSATKWWVGSMGKSANYAILMAQLYTKGTCHGIHAFLLRLRDDNHKVLPGMTVGDIGPKFGFQPIDNGYLRLDNCRIPRENMLMRHAKVLADGTYVKPLNEKIMYGGMLGIRAGLPLRASIGLASAVTIAIRYSLVRRQSELKPNAPEPQILDFKTQQHKLFPLLAQSFAFNFAGQRLRQIFAEVMAEVKTGSFTRLIEAHALSSGLKALTTTRASNGVEVCRLSCGGHGYSLASNLPTIFSDLVSGATAEGEATVLFLQTARYLIKNCISAQSNKRIDAYMSYLRPDSTIRSAKFDGKHDPRSLLRAFEFRAASLAVKAASRLQTLVGRLSQEDAWNESTVLLVKAAVAHTEYVIMHAFVEKVENEICGRDVRKALETLCVVFGTYNIIENSADLLQDGYLTGADVDDLSDHLLGLYDAVRTNAVAYVDGFDIDDRILNSCLGRYDGNVYQSLYDWALKSKLNETQVHDSFHKYMKPLQAISKL